MIPLIQKEIVVSESTPGPFAVNISTYVGMTVGGLFGSFCATLGVIFPSFIIILIVAKCFEKFRSSKIVSGCMSGLKPAVVGLIGASIISVGETVFFPAGINASVFSGTTFYISLVVFVLMTVLSFIKVHPIVIICLSAVIGIAAGYL